MARNRKGQVVLIECVLGAIGLALEQSAFHSPEEHSPEAPQDKLRRWRLDLQRRLDFLTQLRRRIERNQQRLARNPGPDDRILLQRSLTLREAIYEKHLARVRRTRVKLARLERQIRAAG